MKTLIFLILFAGVTAGQIVNNTALLIPTEDQALRADYSELAKGVLFFLDLYAKECYADSTLDEGHYKTKFIPTDTTAYGYIIGYNVIEFVRDSYKHREPSLKGFREFLRKQTRQK